MTPAVRR